MLNNKALAASLSAGPKTYVEDVFSTYLYTGNGSTQTIVNGIDLTGKGGLTWVKSRSNPASHILVDTARGNNKGLVTNANIAEQNFAGSENQISLNSNGFTVTTSGPGGSVNVNGQTYTSWTFRKAAKFFDVVTWTGDGTNNRSINHSLSSNPGVIIVKRTDSTSNWAVYSPASLWTGESYTGLYLNTTGTIGSTTVNGQGISAVSTTSFTVISSGSNPLEFNPNVNGATYVAYLFASNAGGFGDSGNDSIIKCGSFAHGSDTELENLGWEPQWVLVKSTSTGEWRLYDTLRGASTNSSQVLLANSAAAEVQNNVSSAACIVPRATGFNHVQFSFETFIYIAIRRGPMKTPTDATKVFSVLASSGATGTTLTTNFPVDMQIYRDRITSDSNYSVTLDRLRGVSTTDTQAQSPFLATSSTAAENASFGTTREWSNTGFDISSLTGGLPTIFWNFRRAPGFFDVVAYAGDGDVTARTVTHGLTVQPELMIFKARNAINGWDTYVPSGASNYSLVRLNTNGNRLVANISRTNASSLTTLNVGWLSGNVNGINDVGNNYIAYLFATCPGVSKVGSYTGTGNSTLNVNCGFTTGARFVLVKRTDSTGNWYVWDSARGLTVSSAPYLLLNSTATEVTGTTYINSISTGFGVSAGSPEIPVNITGASYIYLAIA